MVSDSEIRQEADFKADIQPLAEKYEEEFKPAGKKKVDSVLLGVLSQVKQARDKAEHATIDNLNKLIDNFIVNDQIGKDFTPLLSNYDQLASQTKFQLPAKAILEQDQRLFIQTLKKLRTA